jgi:hypothetical protein
MAGDLPEPRRSELRQRVGKPTVQPSALTGHDRLVEHLAGQLVTEPHLVTGWREQRRVEQHLQRRSQLITVEPADRGEHLRRRAAGSGDCAQQRRRCVVQRSGSREDHISQRLGHAVEP